jgi:hypothetical protein
MWLPFVETVYEAHFLEDNPLYPYAYSYPYKQVIKSTTESKEVWWVFWSDDFMFYYMPGTDKVRHDDGFAPEGVNPFMVMPMVEMRKDFPVDQYDCLGAFDLVRANQNVNIALNNLNTMVYFQAHDQIVIGGVQPSEVKRIRMGTQDPIVVPSQATFDSLDFNPKITESIEAIKFNIQSIAYSYNLAINWSLEYNPASGFSLLVQNIDLAEAREDDVEIMKMHESDMYKVISTMQEYYKGFKMLDPTEPMLPKDAMLFVDFDESIRLPINQSEEIQRKQFELDNNIVTVVDLIQEDNPDMSEDEAIEKYQRNKKLNGTLSAAEAVRENLVEQGVEFESNG